MNALQRARQRRKNGERGAAVVEFALALPIFLALVALIFDAGLGFNASRSSSSAARSAARVGALAGEDRYADFQVIDAVRAKYPGDNLEEVQWIAIYLSEPGTSGEVPAGCEASGIVDVCNHYKGEDLAGITRASFDFLEVDGVRLCVDGAIDSNWCATDRRDDEGKYLGVAIATTKDAAIGLGADGFDLQDRAVFAMYFEPIPATPTPG